MNFPFISELVSRCLLLGATAFLVTSAQAADGLKLRFPLTGGIFFASMIPALNTGINLSYPQMLQSRNAMSDRFFQAILTKAF